VPPLAGVAARGMDFANSLFHMPRMAKYARLMSAHFPEYYLSRTSTPHCNGNGMSKLYSGDFARSINREHALEPMRRLHDRVRGQEVLDGMLYIDTKTWLPDDLLIKADKITMANSVELRVPLLDHKVLEFAAGLPSSFKVHGLTTKYLFKEALRSRVPETILKRPKTGFPVPYESWLRTDLKDWARDILLDSATLRRGYFDRDSLENLLSANQVNGQGSKQVFSLITLELWHRAYA
jgi:asparagine synthase (glutamine-hydrolysing)